MRSGSSLRVQDDTNKNDALHPIALTDNAWPPDSQCGWYYA